MSASLIEPFHRFFFFLGTNDGTLIIRSIELVFFALITYMIISEFLRIHNEELKYLAMAFGIFTVQKMVEACIVWLIIFSDITYEYLPKFLPVLTHGLELIAIAMLANAFGYPLFKKIKRIKFAGSFTIQLIFLVFIIIFVELAWMRAVNVGLVDDFSSFWGTALFSSIGITYLVIASSITLIGGSPNDKYKANLVLAYGVFAISLFIQAVNFAFFSGTYGRLYVARQPLPFISALLFMRVVYLKLVDKATLQDKLAESESRLEAEKRISNMKDDFVSTVSHELRTPLTSIKLYVALLSQGKLGNVQAKQLKALQTIKEESDRLATLIDDVLDLSKLESGKTTLHLKPFRPYEFLHENMHYGLAKQKGIRVRVRAQRELLVRVDIEKFKQLFINLLSNAVKFTDKGGRIVIDARLTGKEWIFAVSDTGKGIPKDKLENLFTKFYQAEEHMTRTQRGTGLGLAIAKKIVDMHNGTIDVQSQVGKGSTFTVTLPLDPSSE